MPIATILTIDDDKNLQTVVGHYLEDDGYEVLPIFSGRELNEKIDTLSFDVVLLDLVLPDTAGFSLITTIRNHSKAPIIIVSGKSDTTEKIVGLEMGADDYMTKPLEMRELSARIKAVLRRSKSSNEPVSNDQEKQAAPNILFNGWLLDRSRYQLFNPEKNSAELTTGEFKLLEALLNAPNRTLSRKRLFELTRDGHYDVYDRAIDIQIARIRKKLQDDSKSSELIKTVRGVGYMFCGQTEIAA